MRRKTLEAAVVEFFMSADEKAAVAVLNVVREILRKRFPVGFGRPVARKPVAGRSTAKAATGTTPQEKGDAA